MADRQFRAAIAGAGISGLFMAETFKRAGIDFTVYEKSPARSAAPGGTRPFLAFLSTQEIVAARVTDGRWHLETAKGQTDVADVFVCASGFLHKPIFPEIAGRESLAGPSFHSACWDHSVPNNGKRWGVIGSGTSGVQITEALAWAGCNVTQFIRRCAPSSRRLVGTFGSAEQLRAVSQPAPAGIFK